MERLLQYYLLTAAVTLLFASCSKDTDPGTSLTISGLNASDKYFYRVKAGNSLGETDYSKVMSVRKINKELLYNVL